MACALLWAAIKIVVPFFSGYGVDAETNTTGCVNDEDDDRLTTLSFLDQCGYQSQSFNPLNCVASSTTK